MSAGLIDLRQPATPGSPIERTPSPRALVLVHGIFSSHATFEPLVAGLRSADPELELWDAYYFDYDFHRTIPESGAALAQTLQAAFPEAKPEITLVGHSMGGLVSRAALLQHGDLGMVKRLVMLGTPNHGTLHTARLGGLAHVMREATAVLWTVFPRNATGLKDLTQIGTTMRPLLTREGVARTRSVEYVSIPGLRFHEEAGWLTAPEKTSFGLRALSVAMSLSQALPGLKVELRLPHDGIVEESSVRLSGEPAHFSERPSAGLDRERIAPYLHVTHSDYQSVDHVTVHQTMRTIALLAELLRTPTLQEFRSRLADSGEFNLYP
jgi:esterase/lipase